MKRLSPSGAQDPFFACACVSFGDKLVIILEAVSHFSKFSSPHFLFSPASEHVLSCLSMYVVTSSFCFYLLFPHLLVSLFCLCLTFPFSSSLHPSVSFYPGFSLPHFLGFFLLPLWCFLPGSILKFRLPLSSISEKCSFDILCLKRIHVVAHGPWKLFSALELSRNWLQWEGLRMTLRHKVGGLSCLSLCAHPDILCWAPEDMDREAVCCEHCCWGFMNPPVGIGISAEGLLE